MLQAVYGIQFLIERDKTLVGSVIILSLRGLTNQRSRQSRPSAISVVPY